jgi:hypothetical protein
MGNKDRAYSSSKWIIAVVATLVTILYLWTADVISTLHRSDELAKPIPYTEVPYTNIHRGGDQLCDAVAAARQRPSTQLWREANDAYNNAGSGSLKQEDVIKKIRTWPDAGSGTVGRDRVLCVGTAQDPNFDRIALQYYKWSNRCDRTLIFAHVADIGRDVPKSIVVEMHPYGGDDPNNLWQRVRYIVKYLSTWPHMQDIDWIMWYGDDSWVSVANLKKMLREPHYAELDRLGVPLLLGHRMVAGTNDVFVSNSAYVMNVVVLHVLQSAFDSNLCDPVLTGSTDDLPIAQCLGKFGIFPFNTYDDFGEDRMTPFSPQQVADLVNNPKVNPWYPDYRIRPVPKGRDAMSLFPVAYHYVDLAQIDEIEAAVRVQSGASPNGYR